MEKLDYKKAYKDLYLPKTKPALIQVPKMTFFMVDGAGDPNTSIQYKEALELLYAMTFTVKMSKMSGSQPKGYFEYVVPPLEGLWWSREEYFDFRKPMDKNNFQWTSMIRQPEFVTPEVYEWAKTQVQKKKPDLDTSKIYYKEYEEGLCAQIMHLGSYDQEPATVEKLINFIEDTGHQEDFSQTRLHHEIYLGDPRKTKPENLKTVIRHPITKV